VIGVEVPRDEPRLDRRGRAATAFARATAALEAAAA